MNEILKHEELKRAYETDAPLQSVSNITGKINIFEIDKLNFFFL
jgi:hypothetical protein